VNRIHNDQYLRIATVHGKTGKPMLFLFPSKADGLPIKDDK
jgi:hypothetical protein